MASCLQQQALHEEQLTAAPLVARFRPGLLSTARLQTEHILGRTIVERGGLTIFVGPLCMFIRGRARTRHKTAPEPVHWRAPREDRYPIAQSLEERDGCHLASLPLVVGRGTPNWPCLFGYTRWFRNQGRFKLRQSPQCSRRHATRAEKQRTGQYQRPSRPGLKWPITREGHRANELRGGPFHAVLHIAPSRRSWRQSR